jgi:hypothetical protein
MFRFDHARFCLSPRWVYLTAGILFAVGAWRAAPAQVNVNGSVPKGVRTATDFAGASIVERIQAAILDCGPNPCEVYIPAGTYNASAVSGWNSRDPSGARVGILLPSNVNLYGAGQGHTIINVNRSAADPTGTLLANANALNLNIHIHDMSIIWADSGRTFDWVSIFICHSCAQVELDHLSLEGNPNKLVNLLDSTGSRVHDNSFLLRSTSYGHGDNAISFNRFDPKMSVGAEAGVIRDNRFSQLGDYRTFSMLAVTQSGLYVHSNVFEAALRAEGEGNATGIETGQDNLGLLPEHVKISGNMFHGASIAHGGMNSTEISGNFLDHGDIYVALQDGTVSSVSGLNISGNEVHFGSISLAGLEHTFTGRCIISNNRVFDGSIGTGNSLIVGDVEVSYNTVKYSRNNNGIDCNACSIIHGNVVQDIGQNGPHDLHAGYLIGSKVSDVSDNIYIDDQHEYAGGTICSAAKSTSTTCMPSGRSRWIILKGGEWGFGWTNRALFTSRGNLPIRAFVSSSLIELDNDVDALPSTPYHLYRTTFNAFELNAATIRRFANNFALSTTGPFNHAAIQEDGAVRIDSLSGNIFRPYRCFGKCAVNYQSSASAPE